MSWLDVIRDRNWFKDTPEGWNKNQWEKGSANKAQAQDILKDTFIEKVKAGKDTVYIAHIEIKGERYKITTYDMDLHATCQLVVTLWGATAQMPKDEVDNWLPEGTRIKKATLPGGQTNMMGLLLKYPGMKKWLGFASSDHWSIHPTLRKLDGKPFRYFSFYFDELVKGNGYNSGSLDGPWDKWPSWQATKPWHEFETDPAQVSKKRRVFAHIGNIAQRTVHVGGKTAYNEIEAFIKDLGDTEPVWDLGALNGPQIYMKAHVKVAWWAVKTPIKALANGAKMTGQVAMWGVLKGVIPLANIANYYTRGTFKAYMGQLTSKFGIHLFTYEHYVEQMEEVFDGIHKKDKAGEVVRLWRQERGGQTSHETQVEFVAE